MATKSKGPPAPRPGKIGAKTYEVDGESFQYEGAPVPDDEEARVAKLRALKVLDTDAEERFDHITKTLATLFKAPIALVSLVRRAAPRGFASTRTALLQAYYPKPV